MTDPTVRRCPVCHVQAVRSPVQPDFNRCGQSDCPKFEDWPKVEQEDGLA